MKKYIFTLFAAISISACSHISPPEQFGPVPSERQLAWHEMEYYMFVHFTVNTFTEKPVSESSWINGGFFVLEPGIFDYIKDGDNTYWERGPLEGLAGDNQLVAFKHTGFWRPMDTLRDRIELENMWNSDKCDWKIW